MKVKKFKYELGKRAKCKITGFSGIITARVEFLTGCDRYCIQPTELKDFVVIESQYFDEGQIEIVGEGLTTEDVKSEKKGACSPNPNK
jgi:hypothetical protein